MSGESHLLLHGSTPWLIQPAALDPLREALTPADGSPPRLQLRGERLPVAAEHPSAEVLVLGPAPADLESLLELPATGPPLVAVADLRVPGWVPEIAVQSGPHIFHVYRRPGVESAVTFDETEQLAVVHPQYDGFLVAHVAAHVDVAELRIVADGKLASVVTAHHLEGPLLRGQVRAVDLELHPGVIAERGVTGSVAAYDGEQALGRALTLTLATSAGVECLLAGRQAGPLPEERFVELVGLVQRGEIDARGLARAINQTDGDAPRAGWRRWRR